MHTSMHCFQSHQTKLATAVIYVRKMFIKFVPGRCQSHSERPLLWLGPHGQPGPNLIKLFTSVIYGFCSKLECLSLASIASLV
jgi:hypothetical protein